jgi:hypothetical protein
VRYQICKQGVPCTSSVVRTGTCTGTGTWTLRVSMTRSRARRPHRRITGNGSHQAENRASEFLQLRLALSLTLYIYKPALQPKTNRSDELADRNVAGRWNRIGPRQVAAGEPCGATSTYMNAEFGQNLTGLISGCRRRPRLGGSRSNVKRSEGPAPR